MYSDYICYIMPEGVEYIRKQNKYEMYYPPKTVQIESNSLSKFMA